GVLVPVGGEAGEVVRPRRRRPGRGVVEVGPRQQVEGERRPVADQNQHQRRPAPPGCRQPEQEQRQVAEPDLRERVLESEAGPRPPTGAGENGRTGRAGRRAGGRGRRPPRSIPRARPAPPARTAAPCRPGTRTTAGSGRGASTPPKRRGSGGGRGTSRRGCRG